MGKRGPAKLPDQVKKDRGTYQPCRSNPDQPEFSLLISVPPPPTDMPLSQVDIWNEVCEELIRINILQRVDLQLLMIYCNELDTYWKSIKKLKRGNTYISSSGVLKPRPERKIANEALSNVMRIGAQFGLSPSSRQSLKSTETQTPKDKIGDAFT